MKCLYPLSMLILVVAATTLFVEGIVLLCRAIGR